MELRSECGVDSTKGVSSDILTDNQNSELNSTDIEKQCSESESL